MVSGIDWAAPKVVLPESVPVTVTVVAPSPSLTDVGLTLREMFGVASSSVSVSVVNMVTTLLVVPIVILSSDSSAVSLVGVSVKDALADVWPLGSVSSKSVTDAKSTAPAAPEPQTEMGSLCVRRIEFVAVAVTSIVVAPASSATVVVLVLKVIAPPNHSFTMASALLNRLVLSGPVTMARASS